MRLDGATAMELPVAAVRTGAASPQRSDSLLGVVKSVAPQRREFVVRCRTGLEVTVHVGGNTDQDGGTTYFDVLTNLDEVNRDGVLPLPGGTPEERITRHVLEGALISVEGLRAGTRMEARRIHTLAFEPSPAAKRPERFTCLFEDSHWWLSQISAMADKWLEDLFNENRDYGVTDFARFYRTNLGITGSPAGIDPELQECATLSRLIYGLASTYLLTGTERYLRAARAAVEYQRQTFRSLSHDGTKCVWAFGRRRVVTRSEGGEAVLVTSSIIVPSENGEDRGAIPLYEQIYAIAGLAQYYRITLEWEVLEDIRRTLNAFEAFFRDPSEHGGYFSHVHPATMSFDTPALGANQARKNWNSIGDHIPAYLVNLLLALDPLPISVGATPQLEELRERCLRMVEETSQLIMEKFPDPDPKIPYVNERFHRDWTPDHDWGWQRNRAVIGHNLKIAWNLTRCHNYFKWKSEREAERGAESVEAARRAREYDERAGRCLELAERLAKSIAPVGLDPVRGGVYDTVEREPRNGLHVEFAWDTTKDFWQQEQGILAYLILQGATASAADRRLYKELYRELAAFWNLYFLDHDNRGVFFRVNEAGYPCVKGSYGQKAGHAIAGYHSYELNYLAHVYVRTFVERASAQSNFCLHFRPSPGCGMQSINVLPDFMRPGALQIADIRINGIRRANFDPSNFQIPLSPEEIGADVTVEFRVP